APYGQGGEGRVSRVLFVMIISLGQGPAAPHGSGCSRLSASASNLVTAVSEIAAGGIALFTPRRPGSTRRGRCCSHANCVQSGLSTPKRLPDFRRAPSLCAARTFLWG